MRLAGSSLRRISTGGRNSDGAMPRRRGVAIAVAIAALVPVVVACQAPPTSPPDPEEARRVRADINGGLNLYDAGDFVLAAHRFHSAAEGALRCGSLSMERRATQAECTSWLRARRLADFSECTTRLETLHRKEHRADPGLNTLLAMGAVAGGRPIPPFRVPAAVHPLVRAAAKE
jgi:hypothetical protein